MLRRTSSPGSRSSGDFPRTTCRLGGVLLGSVVEAIAAWGAELSATESVFLFSIEQNSRDWVVVNEGATVSVHPNREEAERAVEWLAAHSVLGPRQAALFGDLTPRELVVLQRLNHRGSYTEIARELCVSTNTVKTHVKNVYAKLGVSTRGSALAAATVLGLLDDASEASGDGETGEIRDGRMGVTGDAARKYLAAFAYTLSTHDLTSYARLIRPDAAPGNSGPDLRGHRRDHRVQSADDRRHTGPANRGEARDRRSRPQSGDLRVPPERDARSALPTPNGVLPATGQRFQFASVHVVTFDRSGLVSEIRRYWDLHEVLREQGLASL